MPLTLSRFGTCGVGHTFTNTTRSIITNSSRLALQTLECPASIKNERRDSCWLARSGFRERDEKETTSSASDHLPREHGEPQQQQQQQAASPPTSARSGGRCAHLLVHLQAVVPRGVVPVELEPLVREDVHHVPPRRVLDVVGEELVEVAGVDNASPDPARDGTRR